LQTLRKRGEQVIDLEEIARHRGSVFGGIGCGPQPTQEQFENHLALEIEQLDRSLPIWIEDESRLIGRCHLPQSIYQAINRAPLIFIKRSLSERLENLLIHYGYSETEQLLSSLSRIEKRLGSQLYREIKRLLEENKKKRAFEKLLIYYDKTYRYHIEKRQVFHSIEGHHLQTDDDWANAILTF
jgi:tRNA 2-selenouridine synthase